LGEAHERSVFLPPADIRFFAQLPQPLQVIVLTEDWCDAAIASIRVLVRLAAESSKLNLRFFLRDHNPDIMNQYLLGNSEVIRELREIVERGFVTST